MASIISSLQRSLTRLFILLPVLVGLSLSSPAQALQLDAQTRTIAGDASGSQVTLSDEDITAGRKVFNNTCGTCHAGGITKTNHNVGLDPESLSLATPRRDNVDALVDYMKDPTSYDGEFSIADIHPSISNSDDFVQMRDLSEDDLRLIAGYILVAPKVQGTGWGGGKIYFGT
ncbi:photosystem II cytochrome c-550 [Prochlorococcus sp. MIT 1300]|uniref:photosystem II cytochrome c-550 n=1 Tax=Prochlorococcus sp. MIT 1300 TaxID=3096218 RepID=UPI002A74ADFC|nr:photosystem II cytochrome c-550 [Prochlorococcus sp. MIT 1300]